MTNILDNAKQTIANMEAVQATNPQAWVIENQGFYISFALGIPSACGLLHADRYTEGEARRIAEKVYNGNNHQARAVPLSQALATEIEGLQELVSLVTPKG